MLTWNVCQEIFSDSPLEWDAFAQEVLGEQVHAGRRKGFILSREALRSSLLKLGHQVQIRELQLEGFGRLKQMDSLVLSMTHTSELGAAVVAPAAEFRSVGIDLEAKQRIVRPEVLERIAHAEDISLTPLQRWTLKEAVFKACMNTGIFMRPFEFASIRLGKEEWGQASGLSGGYQLIDHPNYQLALAWIRA